MLIPGLKAPPHFLVTRVRIRNKVKLSKVGAFLELRRNHPLLIPSLEVQLQVREGVMCPLSQL